MRKTWQRLGASGMAAALLSSCAISGLSFAQDDRLEIVGPVENSNVSLPLEVTWRVEDFDGSFAVFFDRSPMRPNQPLLAVVPEDDSCRRQLGCPDEQWLADRNIYVTSDTSVLVEVLPDTRENRRDSDRHDVTIVLLDDQGRRVGESAFTREFIVDRSD